EVGEVKAAGLAPSEDHPLAEREGGAQGHEGSPGDYKCVTGAAGHCVPRRRDLPFGPMISSAAINEGGPTKLSPGGDGSALDTDHDHRILAVDDDETILELMATALAGQQFKVDVARTCEDALPMILFRDYCGIILDIILPDANGLSLFRQI